MSNVSYKPILDNSMISKEEKQTEILLVDDKPENLKVLIHLLENQNFRVFIATSGERALEQTARRAPDLILLDILMPGLDGFETCKQIKRNPELSNIPVIFITALSDVDSKIKAFSVGGVDYISKPFLQEEVLARIETHLTISSQQKVLNKKNKQISESQKQFHDLFEYNPVALWEEDFTEVKLLLDSKKSEYKNDLRKYLDNNPIFVRECAKKIKIININKATLNLHGFKSKDELLKNFSSTFTEKSFNTFINELICIAEKKKSFKEETELLKVDGSKIYVILHLLVIDGYNKVVVSLTNITDHKKLKKN